MMVIYEVNIIVNKDVFDAYYQWLMTHIKDMLQFPGFFQAEIAHETLTEEVVEQAKLSIRYRVKDKNDLDHYLVHHAQAMRAEGMKRFGHQFTASRRILTDPLVLRAKDNENVV